jgi:hypothetical protein
VIEPEWAGQLAAYKHEARAIESRTMVRLRQVQSKITSDIELIRSEIADIAKRNIRLAAASKDAGVADDLED